MTGASLTAVTAMVKACWAGWAPFSPPSRTCTRTVALLTPSGGVQRIRPVGEIVMPVGAVSKRQTRAEPLLGSSGSFAASWCSYSTSSVAVVSGTDVMAGATLEEVESPPLSMTGSLMTESPSEHADSSRTDTSARHPRDNVIIPIPLLLLFYCYFLRSEERRVGNEW